jgi:hypothetical protein
LLVGLEFLGCYYNGFTYKEGCEMKTYKNGELGRTSHSLFTKDISKFLNYTYLRVHTNSF